MSDEIQGLKGFELFHVEDFYPTPKQRIDNPITAPYDNGSPVRVLIGPAKGNLGIVVVDRNANYVDHEPYVGPESIGVLVTELEDLPPFIEKGLVGEASSQALSKGVVRWFNGAGQLEPVNDAKYDC
jgi:hypothetical protein